VALPHIKIINNKKNDRDRISFPLREIVLNKGQEKILPP
jgi:hypothetical protein